MREYSYAEIPGGEYAVPQQLLPLRRTGERTFATESGAQILAVFIGAERIEESSFNVNGTLVEFLDPPPPGPGRALVDF